MRSVNNVSGHDVFACQDCGALYDSSVRACCPVCSPLDEEPEDDEHPPCARCGRRHPQPTHRFTGGPIDIGDETITRFYICPWRNEPVLYREDMVDEDDA